jgi:hypothetical protein
MSRIGGSLGLGKSGILGFWKRRGSFEVECFDIDIEREGVKDETM